MSDKRWVITDGENPGQGREVGYVEASSLTGMVHIVIDAWLPMSAAEFARIQIMAAINEARGRTA